jgi:hypothetical protein
MDELRSRALAVYLQYTFASALAVESVVNQRKQHLDEKTVNASALWVKFCRSAQSACGPYGLSAIDGAESMVLYWLRYESTFDKDDRNNDKNLALKFEKSATCFSKALERQLSGDLSNAVLWSYAGAMYNQADAARLCNVQKLHAHKSRNLREWKARAREYGLPANDNTTAHHYGEISALRREIALTYHTKIAQYEVVVALHVHNRGLADNYVSTSGPDHTYSADYLIRALKYTENALECDKPGEEELQALWRLCAKYMRAAAVEAGTTGGVAFVWQCACNGVAHLAQKLAPAVRMLNQLSTEDSALDLMEMRQRLSDIFQQINASPWVRRPTGDAHTRPFDSAPIEATIDDIAFTLQRAASGSARDHSAKQRFLAAADKVNVDQSPAHRYIKQCWLNAVEQMWLAIAAPARTDYEQHQLCCRVQEKLAQGPLATAAEYFVKADLAVSPQAKDLWSQAAQLTLETTVPFVQQCLQQDPHAENQATFAHDYKKLLRRARHLADAAACCEKTIADPTDSTASTFHELPNAELQLRLAVLKWDAVVPFGNRGCWTQCLPLLDWCVQVPRTAVCMISPPGAPPVSAEQHSETQRNADARVTRAAWLCRTLARVVRVYAATRAPASHATKSDRVMTSLTAFLRQVVDETVTLADPLYTTFMDSAVDAVEEGQRQMEQSGRATATREEQVACSLSAAQFRRCAEYTAVGALRKYFQEHHSSDFDAGLEKGAHARQAGQWYAAAAVAVVANQGDLFRVLATAARCMSEPGIDALKTPEAGSDSERATRDKLAGERFAKAAEALRAGDRELYEMWLRAAEATAHPLTETGWQGFSYQGPPRDPEALARLAQQRQDAADAALPGAGAEGVRQERKRGHAGDCTCVVM